MINFEWWFFVQLFNFLALLVILYIILFKPILKVIKERNEKISGTLEESRLLQKKIEDAMAELKREMAAAKEKGRNIFLKFQKEGFDEQRKILEKARGKSTEVLENAKTELKEETGKARAFLRKEADRLSLEIVKKILGREIYK